MVFELIVIVLLSRRFDANISRNLSILLPEHFQALRSTGNEFDFVTVSEQLSERKVQVVDSAISSEISAQSKSINEVKSIGRTHKQVAYKAVV